MTVYRTGTPEDGDPDAGAPAQRPTKPVSNRLEIIKDRATALAEARAGEIAALESEIHRLRRELHERERERANERANEALRAQQAQLAARDLQRSVASTPPREHELARMRAKLMNGEAAAGELAERLRFAHCQAGKPPLGALCSAVGYSRATLSKVFNGKMAPTWALVRKLGAYFKVPQIHVTQEWLPLWIAADMHRHQKPVARGSAPVVPQRLLPAGAAGTSDALTGPTGYSCPKCGGWVVDTTRHTGWHMAMEPGGSPPDAESTGDSWNATSQDLRLLRQALDSDIPDTLRLTRQATTPP